MKRNWTDEELKSSWQIWPDEQGMIQNKRGVTRLGFAVLLKFFQIEGRFPSGASEIPLSVVRFMAKQVEVDPTEWPAYPWEGRVVKYHRAEIRDFCKFREITLSDMESLKQWLIKEIIPQEPREDGVRAAFLQRCRQLKIEPPATDHGRRFILSAIHEHDTQFCNKIFLDLDATTISGMDALLDSKPTEEENEWTLWQSLKGEPGKASVASVKEAAKRLDLVREIKLPPDLFKDVPFKLVERFFKQAEVEEPFELRRHAKSLKATLQAAFLQLRSENLMDHLADLLVEIVHKMTKKADKQIEQSLGEALQKAPSKMVKLYKIAKASVSAPKGMVENVVFPAAGSEKWLHALILEVESNGIYKGKVKTTLHSVYRSHYRQMLPGLLNSLKFRTTTQNQPVIQALDIVKAHLNHKGTTYPKGVKVPLKGIVPTDWMPHVVTGEGDSAKVIRTAYEICVLKALRDKLRCREIWVLGSRRYRDPEEDLPKDFEERKAYYYEQLEIPMDAKAYVRGTREELTRSLEEFNASLPNNPHVKIVVKKGENRFCVSPYEAKPDPENLAFLKREVNQRWWGTSLLDVVKEADFRVDFTQFLQSPTERSHMDKNALQRRLLLCLFGMGTNTGIKCMESRPVDDYKDLLYVRRRFMSPEGLRQSIIQVVNATMEVRMPQIWGEATTACASDSKQFGAWDQNLLTEWHMRYNGRGVMVYWHVDKNALCVYSQFKRVSSSEVGAMINGVMRHCTEMEIDKQYVDTHGQSTVAFAFCRMLGFELMPRLKDINRQKLYKAEAGQVFSNISKVISPRSIDWELIEEMFDTMVKHAVALKIRMTDAESLLRRFTKKNNQHPVYKAFVELGKALKTIFLCRYLASEEIRREVHEGLNVVESWNGTNNFIFYGNAGELATNRQEDQEMGLLSLHLLQASLVYINTLMIQEILSNPEWSERMTARDLAALSPLLTMHINKYGHFDLDMKTRIPLGEAA